MNDSNAPRAARHIGRTSAGSPFADPRAPLAGVVALAALLQWGHVALPDPMRFALFLACLAGVAVALVRLGARRRPIAASLSESRPAGGLPDIGLDDELASLEAELHSLVDQFRTDSGGVDPSR